MYWEGKILRTPKSPNLKLIHIQTSVTNVTSAINALGFVGKVYMDVKNPYRKY